MLGFYLNHRRTLGLQHALERKKDSNILVYSKLFKFTYGQLYVLYMFYSFKLILYACIIFCALLCCKDRVFILFSVVFS